MLTSRSFGLALALLAPFAPVACTGTPASEPVAVATDEKVLFTCVPEAGSPHARIDVFEITMTPEELAHAMEAAKEADEEQPEPDTTTLEKSVRLSVYELENGAEGRCFRLSDGGRYFCQSFDGGIKLEWKAAAPDGKEPAGPADVRIREKWLFGTKEYGARCTLKS